MHRRTEESLAAERFDGGGYSLEGRKLQNQGIGLMVIKLLPVIILRCYPFWSDLHGEHSAYVNPLKMSISMLLFEVGAFLLLVCWAICFSVNCMDMTLKPDSLFKEVLHQNTCKTTLETKMKTSCM